MSRAPALAELDRALAECSGASSPRARFATPFASQGDAPQRGVRDHVARARGVAKTLAACANARTPPRPRRSRTSSAPRAQGPAVRRPVAPEARVRGARRRRPSPRPSSVVPTAPRRSPPPRRARDVPFDPAKDDAATYALRRDLAALDPRRRSRGSRPRARRPSPCASCASAPPRRWESTARSPDQTTTRKDVPIVLRLQFAAAFRPASTPTRNRSTSSCAAPFAQNESLAPDPRAETRDEDALAAMLPDVREKMQLHLPCDASTDSPPPFRRFRRVVRRGRTRNRKRRAPEGRILLRRARGGAARGSSSPSKSPGGGGGGARKKTWTRVRSDPRRAARRRLAVRCACDDPPPGRAARALADENPERRETLARLAKPNAAAEGGVDRARCRPPPPRGDLFFGRDEATPPGGRARDRLRPPAFVVGRTRPTKPVPRGRKAARSSAPARLPSLLVLFSFGFLPRTRPPSRRSRRCRGRCSRRVARTRRDALYDETLRPSSISTRRFATPAASCFTDARTTRARARGRRAEAESGGREALGGEGGEGTLVRRRRRGRERNGREGGCTAAGDDSPSRTGPGCCRCRSRRCAAASRSRTTRTSRTSSACASAGASSSTPRSSSPARSSSGAPRREARSRAQDRKETTSDKGTTSREKRNARGEDPRPPAVRDTRLEMRSPRRYSPPASSSPPASASARRRRRSPRPPPPRRRRRARRSRSASLGGGASSAPADDETALRARPEAGAPAQTDAAPGDRRGRVRGGVRFDERALRAAGAAARASSRAGGEKAKKRKGAVGARKARRAIGSIRSIRSIAGRGRSSRGMRRGGCRFARSGGDFRRRGGVRGRRGRGRRRGGGRARDARRRPGRPRPRPRFAGAARALREAREAVDEGGSGGA